MTALTIVIQGDPVPKGRPRISTRGSFPIAYTPIKTRIGEAHIRSQAINQLPQGFRPYKGPIIITMCFYLRRPKSLKKSVIHHITRSDIDNLIKTVLDALNTIIFNDDKQIVTIHAHKCYGDPVMTTISIEEIQPVQAAQPQSGVMHSAHPPA